MKFLGGAIVALTLMLALGRSTTAVAADGLSQPASQPALQGEDWYYRPAPEKDATPTISQQKAMARAQQRMARLDSLRWYGFTPGRPQAAPLGFTSMSSPAWQMPGGRPYGWYMASRPVVIYARPYSMYR